MLNGKFRAIPTEEMGGGEGWFHPLGELYPPPLSSVRVDLVVHAYYRW